MHQDTTRKTRRFCVCEFSFKELTNVTVALIKSVAISPPPHIYPKVSRHVMGQNCLNTNQDNLLPSSPLLSAVTSVVILIQSRKRPRVHLLPAEPSFCIVIPLSGATVISAPQLVVRTLLCNSLHNSNNRPLSRA